MYILSRDRLNMDLDRSCLDLMIRLLELDQDQGGAAGIDSTPQFSAREIAKMKEKIRKLCDTVHNKHLDLENITVLKEGCGISSAVWMFIALDYSNSTNSLSGWKNRETALRRLYLSTETSE